MNNILDSEWHAKYGIIVEDVTLRINVSDETRKIVQEMDSKLAETSRMGQVYSNNLAGTMAAATAESMKNAASNENGAMMGFMGMNMATMQGNNIMNTVNNMTSETVTQASINQTSNDSLEATQEINIPKFCPECGTKATGKFCTNCGTKLI